MAQGRDRKTIGKKARALQREKEALRLRVAGLTFREIAEAMGISVRGAHAAVQRGLKKTAQERRQYGEEELDLQISRLERALRIATELSVTQDPYVNLSAVDRIVKCIEKLIMYQGLEPPHRQTLEANVRHSLDAGEALDAIPDERLEGLLKRVTGGDTGDEGDESGNGNGGGNTS